MPDQDSTMGAPEDVVKTWKGRIDASKKFRDSVSQREGWERILRWYRGETDVVMHNSKGEIAVPPINEVLAYVQTDLANTYFRDPYITVVAKTKESVQSAALWEAWLNCRWRTLGLKEEIEGEILDKNLVGHAWHKTGFTASPIQDGDLLTLDNARLFSQRVCWRDIFFDPGASRPPKDCRWMAHRIIRNVEDAKKAFPNVTFMGTRHPHFDEKQFQEMENKADLTVAVLYEIWNAAERQVFTIAEGVDGFVVEPAPWPEHLKEFPFRMLADYLIPDHPYPISAIKPWLPQLEAKMVLVAQMLNHVKRWNRQVFVSQSVPDETMDAYERGDDGAMLKIPVDNLGEHLKFADFGSFSSDFYGVVSLLDSIRNVVSGQPEMARGGTTKTSTRTYKELQMIQEGSEGRTEKRIDRLETHMENIAKDMIATAKANFDEEEVVKVVDMTPDELIQALGPNFDPQTRTVRFAPAQIQGDYDVEIKAGSTVPMDKANRTKLLGQVLQYLAPIAGQGLQSPLVKEVIQELLQDYGLKNLEAAFQQELELMAAKAQQKQETPPEIVAKMEKNMAQADKTKAQAEKVRIEAINLALAPTDGEEGE